MTQSYKTEVSLDKRISESTRILAKYPDRVPIIVECGKTLKLSKKKYLVPRDITASYLLHIIRGKMEKLEPSKAIFLFCDGKLLSGSTNISQVYEDHIYKNKLNAGSDNFLYLDVALENTFG